MLFLTSAWNCRHAYLLDLSPRVRNSDLSYYDAFRFAYRLALAAAFHINVMIHLLRNTQAKGTRKVIQGGQFVISGHGVSQWILLISAQTAASLIDHPATAQTISSLWFLLRWKVLFINLFIFKSHESFFLSWCHTDTQCFVVASQL